MSGRLPDNSIQKTVWVDSPVAAARLATIYPTADCESSAE